MKQRFQQQVSAKLQTASGFYFDPFVPDGKLCYRFLNLFSLLNILRLYKSPVASFLGQARFNKYNKQAAATFTNRFVRWRIRATGITGKFFATKLDVLYYFMKNKAYLKKFLFFFLQSNVLRKVFNEKSSYKQMVLGQFFTCDFLIYKKDTCKP